MLGALLFCSPIIFCEIGLITRMFWTYNGLLMPHLSFLDQLIIVALYGMLTKVRKETRNCSMCQLICFNCHRRQLICFNCDLLEITSSTLLIILYFYVSGTNLQTLDAHAHYVQGVAWDPLGKYVASISSDRTCRIYMNRPKKSKGSERINYVCQQIISKAEYPLLENSKVNRTNNILSFYV